MRVSDQEFKADHGKLRASLLIDGVPRALAAVSSVLTYGAQKYAAHSWRGVDMERYKDAMYRHLLEESIDPCGVDEESGLMHLAHAACNILFLLEDRLSRKDNKNFRDSLKFNQPPTSHKEKAS